MLGHIDECNIIFWASLDPTFQGSWVPRCDARHRRFGEVDIYCAYVYTHSLGALPNDT